MTIKQHRFLSYCGVLLTAILRAQLPIQAESAIITVNAREALGPVPSLVFGQNVEAGDSYLIFGKTHNYVPPRTGTGLWNPVTNAPVPEVVALSKDIGTKMIRYPGGCLAHGFDWKQTVGPVAARPNFTFGLDEFIAACRAIGAAPLITVSDYMGTPQDAADLVEYLNAPATPEHPWAQKRAAWGHPRPYSVTYFEMGNESDHGNHDMQPPQRFTAAEYVAWFQARVRLMHQVDARIKIGALMGTGTGPFDPWNGTVLAGVKNSADYIIVHTYVVGMWAPEGGAGPTETPDQLMRACMAAGDQTAHMLGQYRQQMQRYAGREWPLAITEYNASFVQDKPIPYRFAYGPALFSADYIRILLQPENHVLMANYWQYLNGYWGMLQGPVAPEDKQRPWLKLPAYYLYRLWGQHFGTRLVGVQVATPRVTFEGIPGHVLPATGDHYQAAAPISPANLLTGLAPQSVNGPSYHTTAGNDGILTAKMDNLTGESYLSLIHAPAVHQGTYELSFEAHFTPLPGQNGQVAGENAGLGLGIGDARGWDATHSGIAVEGAQTAGQWTKFSGHWTTLPNCPGADVIWRLRPGTATISGTLEVRDVKLIAYYAESFPAYAAVTSSASLSADGKKLYVIVFNKHHADAIATTLALPGFAAKSARRWTVTGPALDALNTPQENVHETVNDAPLTAAGGKWQILLPARSMTACEFTR